MTQTPGDPTTPRQRVSVQAGPAPRQRKLEMRQLLDRLATTAADRAAEAQGADRQQKLERVARLARELVEALSAVEVSREPGGPQPG